MNLGMPVLVSRPNVAALSHSLVGPPQLEAAMVVYMPPEVKDSESPALVNVIIFTADGQTVPGVGLPTAVDGKDPPEGIYVCTQAYADNLAAKIKASADAKVKADQAKADATAF